MSLVSLFKLLFGIIQELLKIELTQEGGLAAQGITLKNENDEPIEISNLIHNVIETLNICRVRACPYSPKRLHIFYKQQVTL